MNCFLCLQVSKVFFNVCDEIEQDSYKFPLSEAIAKYFSFKPKVSETFICEKCCNIITPFHVFYLQIEETHKQVNALKKKLIPETTLKDEDCSIVCLEGDQNDIKTKPNNKENNEIHIKIEDSDLSETENETQESTSKILEADLIPKQEIDIGDTEFVDFVTTENNTLDNKTSLGEYNLSNNLSILKQEDYSDHNEDNIKSKSEQSLEIRKKRILEEKRIKLRNKKRKERTDWYINRKISKFMDLRCDLCDEEISTFKTLQRHFEWSHGKSGYAICCGVKFYKRYLLVHHIDFHLASNTFKNKNPNQNGFDGRNQEKEYGKSKKKLQCDQCEKIFSRIWTLKQHQAYHTPKNTWKFNCEDCQKALPTHCHLNSHIYFAHKDRIIQCHICYESIKAAHLNKHLKNHPKHEKGRSENDYEQSQSDYEQIEIENTQNDSEGERISIEEDVKHYACSVCNEIFVSEEELNIHIDNEHSLKYPCEICDKVFRTQSSYRHHQFIHTSECMCNYCNRIFKNYLTLKAHVWRDHVDRRIETNETYLERL